MPMAIALVLSALLITIGLWSGVNQLRQLRSMNGLVMPTEERDYLLRRARRRLVNGVLLLALAGMLSGTYLSGMEARADELARQHRDRPRAPMDPEQKEFFRVYSGYWIGILVLIFLVVAIAIADIWATRRYALSQLRQLRDDHRAKLHRDLEMYRQRFRDRMRPQDPTE